MSQGGGGRLAEEVVGLADLWRQTRGDARIRVAVLDGPVDLAHEAFANASLEAIELSAPNHDATAGAAIRHGTHVASLIFGQPGSAVEGVAPGCRGLVVPIFRGARDLASLSCSPIELARAILLAVDRGAHVINVSGGQLSRDGKAHPVLADAVRRSVARGVLIVAAAGNDGCDCLHVPAALPSVLAVGAMGRDGRPMPFSNWGDAYRRHGLLAPGDRLVGARPGGGVAALSGSSVAAPIVAGAAALLMGLDLRAGRRPNAARTVRQLLDNARPCTDDRDTCPRYLFGRLDIARVLTSLRAETRVMLEETSENHGERVGPAAVAPVAAAVAAQPSASAVVSASGCGCASCAAKEAGKPLVFALGRLGYDLVSEARRDSLTQHMDGSVAAIGDPSELLEHLKEHPYEAASITWTLVMDLTPIYAIAPAGPFAALGFERLRGFLDEQTKGEIERVSIPGRIVGRTTLMNGQVVPTIEPELRGMYSWTTAALIEAVTTPPDPAPKGAGKAAGGAARKLDDVRNFFDRVYFELRNLGLTSEERAINYAATNAFQIGSVYESALQDEMELDTIEVERSPICRVDSDCWDVKLVFFYPNRQVQTVRRAYRFTVDVSDVVPVMVGDVRSWFIR